MSGRASAELCGDKPRARRGCWCEACAGAFDAGPRPVEERAAGLSRLSAALQARGEAIADAVAKAFDRDVDKPVVDAIHTIADARGVPMAQVALAWALRHDNVVAIPKAARLAHVRDNAKAADIVLTEEDLDDLSRVLGG
jgi:aryl-alcohol dehydrogenase-like predicted oxidoreductase